MSDLDREVTDVVIQGIIDGMQALREDGHAPGTVYVGSETLESVAKECVIPTTERGTYLLGLPAEIDDALGLGAVRVSPRDDTT